MNNATVPWGDKRTDRGVAHKMQVKSAVAPTATTFDITTSWYASPEPDILEACCGRRLSGNWPLGQQYSLRVISGYFVVQLAMAEMPSSPSTFRIFVTTNTAVPVPVTHTDRGGTACNV